MMRICVYAGSREGDAPALVDAARRLGRAIGERGWGLVYGGGGIGLMRVVADAALAAGAEVIGVIPEALVARELQHPAVADMRVVDTMHARKAEMARLADAFVALPGGFGTLEELFEILTWHQLGLHDKPIGVIDTAGWFDGAKAMIERLIELGLVPRPVAEKLTLASDPETLLERIGRRES